jgi:hypothetical protein
MFRAEMLQAYDKSQRLSSFTGFLPGSNGVSTEAEESPLLRSVTRKRLLKAEYEGLACALVFREVCELAMLVVTSGV